MLNDITHGEKRMRRKLPKIPVDTISNRIIRYRWGIIIGFTIITLFFAARLPKLQIDPELKRFLPENMPSRISTEKIEELFGGTDMLMVLFKTDDVLDPVTLLRIKKVAREMSRMDGVDKVLSLFDLKSIRGENGAMIVNPAVKKIPRTDNQREILRQEIKDNDMVYGSVVSKDFTITAVIAILKTSNEDAAVLQEIQTILQNHQGSEEVLIGGMPFTRQEILHSIKGDLMKLLPLGTVIMLSFLYFCFRQKRGVILPTVVVIMSIVVTMGCMTFLGWKIQIITVALPIILVAVANDYGIHLIAKYQEIIRKNKNVTKKQLARMIFSSLNKPVLITGITTCAGMLCLFGHAMLPARRLGVLAAIGVAFALLASLFFIPAIISLLPEKDIDPSVSKTNNSDSKGFFERGLAAMGTLISRHPRRVVGLALVMSLVTSIGIFFIKIDADPISYFQPSSPIVRTSKIIDTHLGGSQNISVVYKGDIKSPDIMKKIDTMEKNIEAMEEIGITTSVARTMRMMSRALHDTNDAGYDKIPATRNAVSQYFELYTMSGDPQDFEKLVDFPYEHAVITARVNSTSTPVMNSAVKKILALIKGDPDIQYVGGFGLIFADFARLIINGQFFSLGLSIVVVSLCVMVLFRSVVSGFFCAIPLGLSMLVLFGLMGIFSIELNFATALLSSIMIGVGIDYTIHFLWRYREERIVSDAMTAVHTTFTTTCRGIVFNALSVIIGFSVMLFSNFQPITFFGFLVVVSIISCLAGGIVLVPALCLTLKPKFIEPDQRLTSKEQVSVPRIGTSEV